MASKCDGVASRTSRSYQSGIGKEHAKNKKCDRKDAVLTLEFRV